MSTGSPSDGTRFVLVVEDEPVLCASMVRGLSKLPAVEAKGAGSVREARLLISQRPPEVVISDLDLPDGSGLEVAAELDRSGLRVPLLFVSAYVVEYRGRLPKRPGVDVLEKPVALEDLRRLVAERLAGDDEPDSSPFSVVDYVQLAGMGRRSVAIEVRGRIAGRGRIVIRSGEVWSASDERGSGLDAFRRLAFLRDAVVTCATLGPHEDGAREIRGSCEEVLLDAARILDELTEELGSAPEDERGDAAAGEGMGSTDREGLSAEAFDVVDADWETVARGRAERTFDELFEIGVDALLVKDFQAARAAFEAASRFRDDARVRANLHRLAQMGFVS